MYLACENTTPQLLKNLRVMVLDWMGIAIFQLVSKDEGNMFDPGTCIYVSMINCIHEVLLILCPGHNRVNENMYI